MVVAWGLTPKCDTAEASPLECVRQYYLQSAQNEAAIEEGLAFLERHQAQLPATLSEAYRAALIVLKARYAFWPQAKMHYLREGLPILDRLVAAHPDHAELRSLRLLSIYYLPFFLGRKDMAREDMRLLTEQLLSGRAFLPERYRRMMTEFLLANAPLEADKRTRLQALYSELKRVERSAR